MEMVDSSDKDEINFVPLLQFNVYLSESSVFMFEALFHSEEKAVFDHRM